MVSEGFDGRQGDPLADFQLTDVECARLTAEVMTMADRHG